VLLLLLAAGCASAPEPRSDTVSGGRYVMGTALEVTLYGPDPEALARALEAAFAVAERLDALLSVHRADSDVSRLNRAAGRGPVAVDPIVTDALAASLSASRITGGAFDVTVGPLVQLWIDAAQRDALPSDEALSAARASVGVEGIRLHAGGRAELEKGASVDLGGVAKGYALDRMLEVLDAHGVEAALLSFGQSSIWALGRPPDAPGWRLLTRAPGGGFAGLVTLRDQALSISGSLGQGSEIAGRRYGHVLDPRTGWPLKRRRQAVVVAPSATLAEVLSTALLVLGEEEGLQRVAAQPGCAGLLLDEDGRRLATPGFDEAVRFEALPAP
jgi:thiamine biosynthesis lipoprotein